MKQGQEIHLTSLSNPLEVKKLNDALNSVINALNQRFDLSSIFGQQIFSKNANCLAGQWTEITFDKAFADDPAIFAYTEDGSIVKVSHQTGAVNYRLGLKVAFDDAAKSGTVFVTAIGKIMLKN